MISEVMAEGARKRRWWSASRSPFPCINQCLSLAHGAYSTVMSSKGLDIFAGGSRAHGLGGHSDIHHAIVNLQSPSHAPNRLTAFVPFISYGSNVAGANFRETPISRSQICAISLRVTWNKFTQCYNVVYNFIIFSFHIRLFLVFYPAKNCYTDYWKYSNTRCGRTLPTNVGYVHMLDKTL